MGLRRILAILTAAAILAASSTSQAQVRDWGGVGGLRSPGASGRFGVDSFARNSYGLGGIRGSGRTSPLANSVSNSLRRSSAASVQPGLAMPSKATGSRMVYRPKSFAMDMPSASDTGMANRVAELASQSTYLPGMVDALGLTNEGLFLPGEPLKSLAANEEGLFNQQLRAGEREFAQGRYEQALLRFTLANDIYRNSPESLLSLVHGNIALRRYHSAGYHLKQAILYMPELPLANIALRDFFANQLIYAQVRDELTQEAERTKQDSALWLLVAYVQWFDGQPEVAAQALRNAARANRELSMVDTIATFWEGCVSTGKISGTLFEEAAATSQPSTDSSQNAQTD